MSESAEVLSNADASYGTDTETLPDVDIPNLNPLEENPTKEKSAEEIIREAADNVQSCRVCYDEYHTPKNQARVLGCGHTFCTRCVISCSSPMNQNVVIAGIKCPECRKVSDLAPATVPINFQLMQILTVLSLVKDPKTPEQEKEIPSYERFDRLGTRLPSEELDNLSAPDLFEHMKAVMNAVRLRCKKDKAYVKEHTWMRYDTELKKLDDMEKNMHRTVHTLTRIKNGTLTGDFSPFYPFPWYSPERDERRSFHDNDWMREMVVYRPPNTGQPTIRPTFALPHVPAPPTVQDVDAVLEREQAARAEADPRRNVHVVREALLRRERGNAQEREVTMRNEQLMRQLFDRNEIYQAYQQEERINRTSDQRSHQLNQILRRALEQDRQRESARRVASGFPPLLEHDDVTVEDEYDDEDSIASDDSSFIDEPAARPEPLPMTLGEAVTMYRMVEVFSPRYLRLGADSFALPNNHPNLNSLYRALLPPTASISDSTTEQQLSDLRNYCLANNVDCDRLLRNLRHHSIRFAPTVVESPRLTERLRRQRPAPADDYNARLTVIRRRAKEALRGNRPEQPRNREESNLTTRLIVNLATQMGVREKLDHIVCPQHRAQEEEKELFVPRTSSSNRQQMLFCTACRCEVPINSKQIHSQGKRHMANIANRSQSRQHH